MEPRKLDLEVDYREWIAHPDINRPAEKEQTLIDRRDEIEVFGEISDDEASYSYDNWALIRLDGKFYLLQTSGCSCPSPSETWGIAIGPVTLAEARAHIEEGNYSGYSLPKRQESDFKKIFDDTEEFLKTEGE